MDRNDEVMMFACPHGLGPGRLCLNCILDAGMLHTKVEIDHERQVATITSTMAFPEIRTKMRRKG